MLICPKCNYQNELGRIFCHQCGSKLDLDKIKPSSRGKVVRRKGQWTLKRIVTQILWIVILGLLVWGIYSLGKTPALPAVNPSGTEFATADTRRAELERLILRKTPFNMTITATDLNTFFSTLGLEKRASSGMSVVPITLQVELVDGTVKLNYLGTAKVGAVSKKIYISYRGVPTVENGRFEFKPVAGEIGQVPIHPQILNAGFLRGYFARVLEKLDGEKAQLDQLSSISVERDQIHLKYQPKADAPKSGAR